MEPWKKNLWVLWVSVLLCSSSLTMSVPFLPLYLLELGVDKESINLWAGIVHSSAYLVGAIMAPFWGGLADKYGKRQSVIRAGIGIAIIYGCISLVQNQWQLIGLRLLHGFVSGFVPASMAIVASTAPQKEMSWSLGMLQSAGLSGAILGPLFGGVLSEWFGLRTSFVVSSAIIFTATLAVIFWVDEGTSARETQAKAKTSILQTWREAATNRNLMYLLLLLFTYQLAVNMIQPLLTLHIAGLQGKMEGAVLASGIVFSIIGIAGIAASPFWGKIGQRYSYSVILYICLICAGGVLSTQYFVHQLWLFAIIQFICGFFMAAVSPSVNTMVINSTDKGFRGRSFGLTSSAGQLGSMAGPLIGGGLGLALNIHWVFVLSGLILICIGISVFSRYRKQEGHVT
jgi:DHA1 family multidrug resistance protein-like MFS transporter